MNKILLTKGNLSAALAAAAFLQSLAAVPAHAGPVLPAVGPRPPGVYDGVSCGYLKVFSRTEQTQWGDNTYYNPHTAYWIYNANGKRIRTIPNHDTSIDENPQKIELSPGKYFVRAWSDNDGLVTVPVIIDLARTTTVNLEEGSRAQTVDESRGVKTPSGQVVGWKA